jgi:Site-specific recombinases, DNA invertase Pin homologs
MTSQARTPRRFAIYTRQSAEPRDGLSSCEAQFQTCMDFAIAESEPEAAWIEERFDDEGVSGRTLDRPALSRLRRRLGTRDVHVVYAVAMDRLSRTLRDVVVLFDEMESAGVVVRLVHQPELSSGPESRLLRHVLASFAEFEREMIASRIAETRAYLKRHGRRLAGPPPYGYDADPDTKQLVPNRREARRVRAIFRRAARGQAPTVIAQAIDRMGWRTKQHRSKRSGEIIGGGRWTARQVIETLRNPVYVGMFADAGSMRPGCHTAIVNAGLFDAVQQELDARQTTSRVGRSELPFPLRGKVICPGCRRPLCTYVVTHRRGPTMVNYRYYRCRSTAGGRPPCRGVQVPAGEIEAAVREMLGEPTAWRLPLSSRESADAERLAVAWRSLDEMAQDGLLQHLVEQILLRRRMTELRLTLSDSAISRLEARSPAPGGQLAGKIESGRF